MKYLTIILLLIVFKNNSFGQKRYDENLNPDQMDNGIYFQAGPGSSNGYNWTYPFGTKLTVKGDTGGTRLFEITTDGYASDYQQIYFRNYNKYNNINQWHSWKRILTENKDGFVGVGTKIPTAVFEVKKSINGTWTSKISNTGGEALGLLIKSGNGRSVSSNSAIVLQCEDNEGNVRLKVQSNGKVGIGTSTPDSKLTVAGKIHAQEVKVTVDAGSVPDYVFAKEYNLKSLKDIENYIESHHHLPDVKSAEELSEEGLHLAEMNLLLLKKVEELTLYTIEQEKRLNAQKEQIDKQTKMVEQLIHLVESLSDQ